ncbi:DUF202 domain-containing protein [Spelaeicoccus albus]|uniref:Uncharacterized membrane protein YidH (DUF202 family) n=1 Tax=Spelaeicoccus albus TaxID=1280376 RepID=A0A7Z0D1Z9_9MICO|nr:DUF202 domain-containing protein [Spelaeicoccus albus]NYI67332.1 uncharacterized membrane protein YidH (DUF202 family) [Spelaeicoccus albus]
MSKNRDPGLQPERTALAWNRTALAIGVNSALLLRSGITGHNGFITTAALALGLLAAGVTLYSSHRRNHFREAPSEHSESRAAGNPLPHAAISLMVVGAALVAMASIVLT